MKTTLAFSIALLGLLALGTAHAGNHGHQGHGQGHAQGHEHGHNHGQPQAQRHDHSHGSGHAQGAASGELPKVEAEVRRVNTRANTVSLRHGPIPNLDMPPMTMTFKVSDAAQLEGLKTGDKVHVTIEQVDGEYTLMSMEPAQ